MRWDADPCGRVRGATVDMGPPILEPSRIPVNVPGERAVAWPWGDRWREASSAAGIDANGTQDWIERSGIGAAVSFVSMGNPHLVAWCASVDAVPLERIGPVIERLGMFPQRMNVHVAETVGTRAARMRTWERGSGITQACGTGACAVCVAGQLEGRLAPDVDVDLPGGRLRIEWPGAGRSVLMTGPAVTVYEGVMDLDAIGAPECAIALMEHAK